MGKLDIKVGKYLAVILSIANSKLFQNNCDWNNIKKDSLRWDKLQLSLLDRISVMKMNVLPKMFLFQMLSVLMINVPFKQWKNISKFIRQEKNENINCFKMLKRED